MNDRTSIREYRLDDASACRDCIVELQDAERQFDRRLRPGEEMADQYLADMHVRCREHAGVIFVAEDGGAIVGLAMLLAHVPFESLDEPPGHYAVVAELIVRSGFRRRGIGAQLLSVAERHARSAGAPELRINVLSKNHVARQLYLDEGFAPYIEILAKPL